MRKPKIIIKKAGKQRGHCMVVIKSANGKVLLTSEILSSKRNALFNIDAALTVFQQLDRYNIGITNELA
jgi:uncharacterized protein YegP (UPF0339 family)